MNDPRITSQPAAVKPEPDMAKIGLTLANAVYAATHFTRTAYIGHTWGDFKRAVEQLGIRDGDTLASIEVGIAKPSSGYIQPDRDEFGGIEIREVRRG